MSIYINELVSYIPNNIDIRSDNYLKSNILKLPLSSIQNLIDGGYENVAVYSGSLVEIFSNLLTKLRKHNENIFHEIDAIVICTESIINENDDKYLINNLKKNIHNLLIENELNNITIYANYLSGCGNAFTTICLASSLINSKLSTKILCLFADKNPEGISRLIDESNLRGDGGVCLVMSETPIGINITRTSSFNDINVLRDENTKDFLSHYLSIQKMMIDAQKAISHDLNLELNSYDLIILDNFHELYLDLIIQNLKLSPNAVSTPCKIQYAHVPPIDTLLNLEYLFNQGEITSEKNALINLSQTGVGLIEFESVI